MGRRSAVGYMHMQGKRIRTEMCGRQVRKDSSTAGMCKRQEPARNPAFSTVGVGAHPSVAEPIELSALSADSLPLLSFKMLIDRWLLVNAAMAAHPG